MKNANMLIEMLVAITNKNELIDEAINSLQVLKTNINNEEANKIAALKCIKIYLKVTQGDKSLEKIITESQEHSKVLQTAGELIEMTKDLKL